MLFGFDLTGMGWLDPVLATAGSVAALVLAWLLFPVAIGLILGLFAEDVVAAVERRYYPELPRGAGHEPRRRRSVPGARFLAVGLAAQSDRAAAVSGARRQRAGLPRAERLSARPRVLQLVAGQRLPLGEMDQLRRRQRGRLWLAGALIALMLIIPGFNLIAPVVAIAFMVHLVMPRRRARRRRRGPAPYVGWRTRQKFDRRATESFDFDRGYGTPAEAGFWCLLENI